MNDLEVFFPDWELCGNILTNTLEKDATTNAKEALIEIYRRMRPGDPPTLETATQLFHGMFFDSRKYDFSRVGRMKFNIKIHGSMDASVLDDRTLDAEDFYSTIGYLLKLRRGLGEVDDIDHLGVQRSLSGI